MVLASLTVAELLEYVSKLGVLSLLVLIIYGGYKRWWVFGWVYKDAEERCVKTEKERDDWRNLALKGTNLAEQTVTLFRRSKD